MQLSEFTYLPAEGREKALRFLAFQIGDPESNLPDLMVHIEGAFAEAYANNEIIYQEPGPGDTEPGSALFRIGFTTTQGDEVLGKCVQNQRPGGAHKWFGLFFQTVRREGFTIGDVFFRSWSDGQRFLEEVAALAIPERWTYQEFQSRQAHPILKSYLEHTLARLKLQEKIIHMQGQALFNTGLINRFFKEIYVVAEVDPETPNRLLNPRAVLETDRVILDTFRNKKPEMARFFTRIADVIFDPELEINTDDSHIIEDNFERIPVEYRAMKKSQLFALFQAGVQFSRIMAARNYKLIVPHVYRGKIQFLMPIYLSGEFDGPPDVALVLEKIGHCYRGNTILTLDMAYQNARLIAKPEASWLTTDVDPS